MHPHKPTIFLDRDGVINHESAAYVKSAEEWLPIDGSLAAMGKLYRAGFALMVATNQSGVGRGIFSLEALHQMHQKMQDLLALEGGKIEAILFCPHHPDAGCACRKPKPGLLQRAQQLFQLDLSQTYFIGDSARDIDAARAVGSQPILVRTGFGKQTLIDHPALDIPIFDDLAAAVDYILDERRS